MRVIARLLTAVLVAFAAVTLACVPVAAAKVTADALTGKRFGIVPPIPQLQVGAPVLRTGGGACDADQSDCTALSYAGGPVQHSETDYLFFWTPSGHTAPASYVSGIQTWLNEVAAANYTAGNPFSVDQQYYDMSGPGGTKSFVPYAITNGGTIVDGDSYPSSGCNDSAGGNPMPVCLTDSQIKTELSNYVSAHSLPTGIGVEYFVMTPQGVGSCFDSSSTSCSYTAYCGYHSYSGSGGSQLIYADMPWAYTEPGCDVNDAFGAGYPNSDFIDPVVGVFSHELSETMTDPNLDAWYQTSGVDGGYEIGDKCAYIYGSGGFGSMNGLSNNGSGYWNVQLGSDLYLLQMEFDNRTDNCAVSDGDTQPSMSITVAPSSPVAGVSASLTANVTDSAGVAYVQWNFGDGTTATGTSVNHTYSTAGSVTVKAVVTDGHGNELQVSKHVTVTAPLTWSGGAASAGFSSVSNWSGGTAPAGSVTTLTFPALASAGCSSTPPASTCYTATNDLSGLSTNSLSIDDGVPYAIGGNALTLGSGGINATTSDASGPAALNLALALSSSQTWSIDGGSQHAGRLDVGGALTGSSRSLSLDLSNQAALKLAGDDEVGTVTIAGSSSSDSGASARLNGTVTASSLNASDGSSVALQHAGLVDQTSGATGALNSAGGDIEVGQGSAPATLSVNGALTLDSSSRLVLYVDSAGTTAGTDYSSVAATGAVSLAGSLVLNGGGASCPALHAGDVEALISTGGTLSGTFTGIADGQVVELSCTGGPDALQINYGAHSVTATVVVPVNTVAPSISGSLVQGQTLTESAGTWVNFPSSLARQWEQCDGSGGSCAAIPGATGLTYTLGASDVGHTIRVQEIASNGAGAGAAASSAATAPVAPVNPPAVAPSNSLAPAVSGTAAVGQPLTASTGAWSGTTPLGYAYQWQRCASSCANIAGATHSSYTATGSDAGAMLRVVVTAQNLAGSSQAASHEVGPVTVSPAAVRAALLAAIRAGAKAARTARARSHGTFTFAFDAPAPGALSLSWYLGSGRGRVVVATASAVVSAAGAGTITGHLTAAGRHLLAQARRLTLRGKGSFTPAGEAPVTAAAGLRLPH